MNANSLPILFKRTSTGAIQTWRIWTVDDCIFTEHGQLSGRMQTTEGTRAIGKNAGRSNETTPAEQALLEAHAKWESQLKKRYVKTLAEAEAGEVDAEFVTGGISPMLAKSYKDDAAKIHFPAAVQPKLDGHRCIAIVNDDRSVGLWSRSRKPITGVPHIAKAVEALRLPVGTALDGELYNHAYHDKFEQLTSFIRQATPKPGHEVVHYHVYDIATITSSPFKQRTAALACYLQWARHPIVLVETQIANDADDLTDLFLYFVDLGYEGAIVRNLDGLYVNKRSNDLQKVKEFEDAEFPVIRVENGRGKMENLAIFVCQAPGGEFRCKMRGALADLAQYLDRPELAVGKMLTVQFQEMTRDGVPRFPVGLRLRKDA
jgi:DNA ligase-1